MATIVTRSGKGSPLTNTEVDANFTNLNNDKLETSAAYSHPTGNGNNHIPSDGSSGQILGYASAGTAQWQAAPSSDLVDDTSPQLGGDLATNGHDVLFADNDKLKFGADPNLEIYHDGGSSYIDDIGSGSLALRTNGFSINMMSTSSEWMGKFVPNGNVELYYDNAKKFETTATGIDVTGNITVSGTVDGRDIATNIPSSLGSAGQVLTVNSGASAAEWAAAGGGSPDLFAENYDGTSGLPSATGTNAVAIGVNASAGGVHSFVAGRNATDNSNQDAVVIGRFASASANETVAIGEQSDANGLRSVALGYLADANGSNSISVGTSSRASSQYSIGIGADVQAISDYSTAIGYGSGGSKPARAETGAGAMALGGSYASGTDSFAAAIANNTSSYGATGLNSVAIGNLAKATGEHSIALGKLNIASNHWAFVGGYENTGSGAYSATLGSGNTNSGAANFCVGYGSTADGDYGAAIGRTVSQRDQNHTLAFGLADQPWTSGSTPDGASQTRITGYAKQTADASPLPMNGYTSNHSVNANNSFTLPNNAAATFSLTVIANVTGGGNSKAWKLEGAVKRGASASATALIGSVIKTTVAEDSGAANWDVSIAANTTIGGLVITCTGQASTSIRWVGRMDSTEVTY